MNRDFIRYCEELIAIKEVAREGLPTITADMAGIPLHELVSRAIGRKADAIGQDKSISAPKKIKDLLLPSDPSLAIAESYIQLRNCFEHHHGTPKTALSVIVYTLSLNVPIGGILKKGRIIGFKP